MRQRTVDGDREATAAIDKQRAVDVFLTRINGLSRLPLISDEEIRGLYGGEVAEMVAELGRANEAEGICRDCGGKCCATCGCELYSGRFDWCPIHAYRPVVCRLHFCHRFEAVNDRAVIDLGDVFFDGLLAAEGRSAERGDDTLVRLFDSPPLARNAPQLTATAAGWMSDLEAGVLNPKQVTRLLRRVAAKFRMGEGEQPPAADRS